GFELWDGQKIRGSGIDATTVQVRDAVDPYNVTGAFGSLQSRNTPFDSLEITDLTVDAFARGQPAPPSEVKWPPSTGPSFVPDVAPVTTAATGLTVGGNLRFMRIRATDFGTQSFCECFVLYLTAGPQNAPGVESFNANNSIADCITELPGENSTHESTLIWPAGGGSSFNGGVTAAGLAQIAARNFVNCEFPNGVSSQLIPIQAITTLVPPDSGLNKDSFEIVLKLPPGGTLPRDFGKNLVLNGIQYLPPGGGGYQPHPYYNAAFPIISRSGATFRLLMFNPPPASKFPSTAFGGYVGVDFHGPNASNCSGGVVEGNAVYDCVNPCYTDTGSSRDIAIRYNYYSNILTGVYQNFNQGSESDGGFIAAADGVTP
ncbi:MAG: hypothetical protein ABL994_23910, partial [Verrucomicrobiales bacterium]